MSEQATPMMERWLRLALKDQVPLLHSLFQSHPITSTNHRCIQQAMASACTIFAHLAYRYKNASNDELDRRAISIIQLAQIFLNIHHHYTLDAQTTREGDERTP